MLILSVFEENIVWSCVSCEFYIKSHFIDFNHDS